jgi:ribosomal protein L25 (general stress protein Ctc)
MDILDKIEDARKRKEFMKLVAQQKEKKLFELKRSGKTKKM